MASETVSKIRILIQNIDDIQECIENSNFELMDKYVELFLTNYTKSFMDIITYSSDEKYDIENGYWFDMTNRVLEGVKSKDVFSIMDILYFDLRKTLVKLVDV